MNEDVRTCQCCEQEYPKFETVILNTPDGGVCVCEDCRDEHFFFCEHCGEWHCIDTTSSYEVYVTRYGTASETWCQDCVYSDAQTCYDCDELYAECLIQESPNGLVCQSCFENNYRVCEQCGEVVCEDDIFYDDASDEHLCEDCYHSRRGPINGYHDYYSYIKFVPKGTPEEEATLRVGLDEPTFGPELEIDRGGLDGQSAELIAEAAGWIPQMKSDDMLVFSEDGSLDDGFEIISQPLTLKAHKSVINWEKLMEEARRLGYRSHDAGTCGLHIHIGREYFEKEKSEVDKAFTVLFNNNEEWLKEFSRRRGNYDYCHFQTAGHKIQHHLKRVGILDESEWNIMMNELSTLTSRNRDKYNAVNLGRRETVELRLFRGTLIYSTFIAALELARMMCTAVKSLTFEDVSNIDMNWFVREAKRQSYDTFISYLKQRDMIPVEG